MKNLLLISSMFLCSIPLVAQEHPTEATQCQLSVNDILLQQSFDIDDPVSEDARYILFELYNELNGLYQADQSNQIDVIETLVAELKETLEKAEALQLNLVMFDDDLNFAESLNQ